MANLISTSRNFNHFLLSSRVHLLTLVNQRCSKTFSHNNAKTSSFRSAAGGDFIKPAATFSGQFSRTERLQSNIAGEQLNTIYCEEYGHHQINDESQLPGLCQTILRDSSTGLSTLLPVNCGMCLNDQGLRTEQLISPKVLSQKRANVGSVSAKPCGWGLWGGQPCSIDPLDASRH
ncbi:hypothetical protein RND71_039449 [Anisodus tanguticus]|uniref:Uncharacterized protein n=1 Tax=Anisodus tanguticus TaxID=243964 RepID=A0AAE1QWM5_9SOLA|nr:hypothetical protein RND71_039449 [Anisodus tanguticus]